MGAVGLKDDNNFYLGYANSIFKQLGFLFWAETVLTFISATI